MAPMMSSEQQTAIERFLTGVTNPVRWLGFVAGCVGALPFIISLFLSSAWAKMAFGGLVAGGFGVFILGTLVYIGVRSGLIHGWASMRELKALIRREEHVNRLMQRYGDHLELRKASEDLLKELGAPNETLTRIRETSAELERMRAQRERLMQG